MIRKTSGPRSEKKGESRARITFKWSVALAVALVMTLLVCLVPDAMKALTYPDARANTGSENDQFTKVFNVRRAKNNLSGVNFGLALQAPREGDWGVVLEESDFNAAQRAGFNYIRVHVQFLPHLSMPEDGYQLDENLLTRLDWVIEKILERDMIAIVDFYWVIPDDKLAFNSQQDRMHCEEKFLAVWEILIDRYRDYPDSLYFELANEPHRPIDGDVWNSWVQQALKLIRKSGGNNATRMVVVGTPVLIGRVIHTWDQVNGIEQLQLPSAQDDPNIMVTFHYYNPYPFTHQEQTYTRDLAMISWLWKGNRWVNSDKQIAYVRRDFDRISQWAHENNRKVILGEFGVSIYADIDSQVQWVRLVREEAESRGMVWTFWDFFDQDELGALYNQSTGYWRKEILEALLPEEKWPYENAGGNQSESCIRELTERLKGPEWTIRRDAAISLRLSGPDGESAIPALIEALKDEEWQVRKEIARALACFGPASYPAVPALVETLHDEEWQVRKPAIEALGAIGQASHPALPELIELLGDEEWQIREQAVLALASIAPQDVNVQTALQAMLDDPEDQVRRAAQLALNKDQ